MIAIQGIGRFRKLDVRPVIARGEQPLARIEEALAKLGTEEALEVHSPFLPAPLIERLSSEGYRYQFEATAPGHWTVYFWREDVKAPAHGR
jgi:uncharacterized protein (DUF2249 family)